MNHPTLKGVIGIVANDSKEIDLALSNKLSCVEIRADLLLNKGLSVEDIFELVKNAKQKNLYCLFTLRHRLHGGKFYGTEKERIQINKLAIDAGVNCLDLEWGTEAEFAMFKENAPLLISYHDFSLMPTEEELEKLTLEIEEHYPHAIKVVPTASKIAHAVQILKWVKRANNKNVPRIGFAMGNHGSCSRILTTLYGSPITYAAFGEVIAPGQISMDHFLNLYRIPELEEDFIIFGVAGECVIDSESLQKMNILLKKNNIRGVSVPLEVTTLEELLTLVEDLNIVGVQLDDPLKEIAIQKFPEIGNDFVEYVFLDFLKNKGESNHKIIPLSGYSYLKKKYEKEGSF